MPNFQELLNIATRASLEAGADIMRIYTDPAQDFGIERKADNSPLTLADKASHQRIMEYLEPTGIPVLSEEGIHLPYEERRQWEYLWVVDPLDGTKEFIRKNGEFTVNIALIHQGSPVLGVILVPATNVLYTGIVGAGAWKRIDDGDTRCMPLRFNQQPGEHFTIVASRSHMSPETEAYVEEARRSHKQVELISSGSSLKICLVAEGTADAYPRFAPTMEWDTAAGDAIARAANKQVIDATTGQPLQYNKPDLHNPWFLVSNKE